MSNKFAQQIEYTNPTMEDVSVFCDNWVDEEERPAGGSSYGPGFAISWQNGPLGKVGSSDRKKPNGAFVEAILLACWNRIAFYQDSEFKCKENEEALKAIDAALSSLNSRTNRRVQQEVEGTHEGN